MNSARKNWQKLTRIKEPSYRLQKQSLFRYLHTSNRDGNSRRTDSGKRMRIRMSRVGASTREIETKKSRYGNETAINKDEVRRAVRRIPSIKLETSKEREWNERKEGGAVKRKGWTQTKELRMRKGGERKRRYIHMVYKWMSEARRTHEEEWGRKWNPRHSLGVENRELAFILEEETGTLETKNSKSTPTLRSSVFQYGAFWARGSILRPVERYRPINECRKGGYQRSTLPNLVHCPARHNAPKSN